MSALTHSVRLARIDARRMVRKNTDWSRGISAVFSVLVFVVGVSAFTLGGGYLAFRIGEAVAAGTADPGTAGIAAARGVVAVLGLILTVVIVIRAFGQRGTVTNAEGVLTIVPAREAMLGTVLAEISYVLLWLGGPAIGVGVGLAVGLGSPWPALTVPLSVLGMSAVAVTVGYPLGVGLRHVATRFAFVVRNKATLLVIVFVAYFAVVVTGSLNAAVVALFEPMQSSPTGWFADLLFLSSGAFSPEPLLAAGAVGVALALGAVGTAAGVAVVNLHWFSDPALAAESEPESATESSEPGLERRLAPAFGPATASLITLAWRRAMRAPLKLLYAVYPLLFGVGIFADIFQTGEVPAYLPVAALAFVAWAAGAIFTLNPLGDQGAALATTLLSRVDGRQFVRAHLLASLLIAVPLGIALTVGVALISPVDTLTAVALVVAAPVVMLVSSALSVGIGVAFPRFEAVNISRSMKTVVPSTIGFVLFTLHLLLTVFSGAVVYSEVVRTVAAAFLTFLLPFGLTLSAGTLLWIAAVALVPLVVAPALSYRYAVRRFDTYTFE